MLRIGGVAEHYNLPWHLLIESGKSEQFDLQLQWRNCDGGTGEMITLLNEEAIDIAVLLTEGMISGVLKGNTSRILKVFVKSSLEWGVHVSNKHSRTLSEMDDPHTFGISRTGSGSHLMALLYAREQNIPLEHIRFLEVGSLEGAMEAFDQEKIDAFLWERYTTEPYCKRHALKRIDSIFTPWSCFVIAIRPEFYHEHQPQIDALLKAVFEEAHQLKHNPDAVALIASRYQLSEESAQNWFEKVQWGEGENLTKQDIKKVIQNLEDSSGLGSVEDVDKINDILISDSLSLS